LSDMKKQKRKTNNLKLRIKKGDTVEVITGKDRGSRGVVERVLTKQRRMIVTGVNIVKRHQKSRSTGGAVTGGIIEKPAPIDVSNVMLVCPNCDLKTRAGYRIEKDQKVRVCKKCHKEIK